jgi:hypothetical protein
MTLEPPNALAPRPNDLGPVPPPDPQHPGKPASNTTPHWPAGIPLFGDPIAQVQSVMINETSGWSSYASSGSFRNLSSARSTILIGSART